MIGAHDRVVLTTDLAREKLAAGDVGTVVHVYREGQAFEVEFVSLDGETVAIVTLEPGQIRAGTGRTARKATTEPLPDAARRGDGHPRRKAAASVQPD